MGATCTQGPTRKDEIVGNEREQARRGLRNKLSDYTYERVKRKETKDIEVLSLGPDTY